MSLQKMKIANQSKSSFRSELRGIQQQHLGMMPYCKDTYGILIISINI